MKYIFQSIRTSETVEFETTGLMTNKKPETIVLDLKASQFIQNRVESIGTL